MDALKRLSFQHKNLKFLYYAAGCGRLLLPRAWWRRQLPAKLAALEDYDPSYILSRVNYCNKLDGRQALGDDTPSLGDLRVGREHKTYFFDSYEYARFFDPRLRARFLFGDVIRVPGQPSFVKTRPIAGDNANSVLLKLNKVRHFIYTNDRRPFETKKDVLVGRSNIRRPHRIRFAEMYFDHPLCDIGQPPGRRPGQWIKPRLTINEQLNCKFVLCLEGNDVASNLKWVMSSNSLAVMPEPTYESWFMEAALVPDFHYVRIKADYSDLEDRLRYYMKHTNEALQIIRQAQQYVHQFKDSKREDLISLLVMKKYFTCTGQM